MGYQFEMARYARKYKWPSWVIFDMHFRQEAACRPALSWAEAAGHKVWTTVTVIIASVSE